MVGLDGPETVGDEEEEEEEGADKAWFSEMWDNAH
jgi:hypothetical protein